MIAAVTVQGAVLFAAGIVLFELAAWYAVQVGWKVSQRVLIRWAKFRDEVERRGQV